MRNPSVVVTELSPPSGQETVTDSAVCGHREQLLLRARVATVLGNVSVTDGALDAASASRGAVLHFSWNGGKIPFGVRILGHEVGWTQGGTVTSTEGIDLGTYERLVDSGGPGANRQEMRVRLRPRLQPFVPDEPKRAVPLHPESASGRYRIAARATVIGLTTEGSIPVAPHFPVGAILRVIGRDARGLIVRDDSVDYLLSPGQSALLLCHRIGDA